MRTVAEHQAVVAALFDAPQPVRLSTPEALGCATLADVDAPLSLPGFDNSAMDGFAVLATDLSPPRAPSDR